VTPAPPRAQLYVVSRLVNVTSRLGLDTSLT
jgi:hypothetical protein